MPAPQAPAANKSPVTMMSSRLSADAEIDVTNELCPMTYVRTRLALDRLAPGQLLCVLLSGPDAIQNVPASARAQGHTVLSMTNADAGQVQLIIQKSNKLK